MDGSFNKLSKHLFIIRIKEVQLLLLALCMSLGGCRPFPLCSDEIEPDHLLSFYNETDEAVFVYGRFHSRKKENNYYNMEEKASCLEMWSELVKPGSSTSFKIYDENFDTDIFDIYVFKKQTWDDNGTVSLLEKNIYDYNYMFQSSKEMQTTNYVIKYKGEQVEERIRVIYF